MERPGLPGSANYQGQCSKKETYALAICFFSGPVFSGTGTRTNWTNWTLDRAFFCVVFVRQDSSVDIIAGPRENLQELPSWLARPWNLRPNFWRRERGREPGLRASARIGGVTEGKSLQRATQNYIHMFCVIRFASLKGACH